MSALPSPEELWNRYQLWKGLSNETTQLAATPYHDDGSGKEPRYYQRIAIQRTVEAVAQGDRRILLVMATGTGKTYTASSRSSGGCGSPEKHAAFCSWSTATSWPTKP